MNGNGTRACIFGEVLFDHFPDGRRVLGGAPFNVAWHLQAFGEAPFLVSRVGDDEEGDEVRSAMRAWGMDPAGLQTVRAPGLPAMLPDHETADTHPPAHGEPVTSTATGRRDAMTASYGP